jgi:VIT1/CCC1 family predicted Fe2+/Mn2+ transporter
MVALYRFLYRGNSNARRGLSLHMTDATTQGTTTSAESPAVGGEIASKLNWLRAGVLGANDGIVSTAALIFGVAGAEVSHQAVLISGVAAVVAGSMSMAVGEYISVSSQRDLEKAELEQERRELERDPEFELHQLTRMLQERGISADLSHQVAVQLTEQDPLAAHARLELNLDPNAITNPWHAAFASLIAFIIGGLVPLLAILLAPVSIGIPVAAAAVVIALAATGSISARMGGAPVLPAIARTVFGGILAMGITYGVGYLTGTQLG